MKARIRKIGDSLAVVIPTEMVEAFGFTDGAEVEVQSRFGAMTVFPPGRTPLSLEEMLEGVTDENIHPETDWGPPVGKEVL